MSWNNELIQKWLDENEKGYFLVSPYQNSNMKLTIQCPNGHHCLTTWKAFYSRGLNRCKICDRQKTLGVIQDYLNQNKKGYTLISKEYIGCSTKLIFRCDNKHEFEATWNGIRNTKNPCQKCRELNRENQIKNYIKENTEGYLFLRKHKEKTTLICPKGHEFTIFDNKLLQGRKCPVCGNTKRRKSKKFDYKHVKNTIEKRDGFVLLSKTYEGNSKPLLIKCPKGHSYKTTFAIFQKGCGCPTCKKVKRYTYDDIKNYIEIESESGYKLISENIKNTKDKITVECPIGHRSDILFGNFKKGSRCWFCRNLKLKKEGSPNYKQGRTLINKHLRHKLKDWRNKTFESTSYRCFITNKTGELEAHHPFSFYKIVDNILGALHIEGNKRVSDYSEEELQKIEKAFLEYHDENLGFPMLKTVHKIFHSFYGNDVNVSDVFDFKKRYENNEIIIKQ